MARHSKNPSESVANRSGGLAPPPLDVEHWQAVVGAMGLSRREATVAELKIRGAQLKQIAAIMDIDVASVRSYMDRVLAMARTGRHEFFSYVLRLSHDLRRCARRQK